MAKPGKQKRRTVGVHIDLSDQDWELLLALVGRYQKPKGPAFKSSKIFVIRQLLRHTSAMKKLPDVLPDDDEPTKPTNGMVVELGTDDTTRLVALVDRYENAAGAEGYRSSKVFVIRQLLRYAAELKELPPLRG